MAECFERGYEEIIGNEKEILKDLVKKRYEMYIHVHTKLENFDEIKKENNIELDKICKQYIESGRDIKNPDKRDISWIESRIKKLKGVTQEIFLIRCRELKNE